MIIESKHLHVLKMVTWKQHGFLNIIYSVCFLQTNHAYINRCPEMVELELYSKRKCTHQKEYHCLEEDGIELKNREECRTPEWVSIGNYPLFRGKYIDYEMCPADSYQPSLFRSNENYKCVYLKSNCSSEGQVEVNKGNRSSDIACRCDSNRGFAFVIRPQNQRACISSQEDCSCYSKRCADGQKLNPDYECKTVTVLHRNSTYHVVTETDKENTSHNASLVVTNLNSRVTVKEGHTDVFLVLTSLMIFVVIMVSVFVFVSFNNHPVCWTKNTSSNQGVCKNNHIEEANQKEAFRNVYTTTATTKGKEQTYDDKENNAIHQQSDKENKVFTGAYKETAASENNRQSNVLLETTAMREIDKQSNKGNKEINRIKTETESSTSTEKAEMNRIKTETESSTSTEKAEINRIKTVTESSTSTEKADIVILHIEEGNQKIGVESFKSHLASLSEEMECRNINIKLFEDIFHWNEYGSDVEIETVLTKCHFIFVYISNNFYTSMLRRLGLKESCIKDAMEGPTTKTHIKIVSNCDYWELPDGRYLTLKKEDIDLDYFYYVKKNPDIVMEYKKTYKDCLEKIQHNDKTEQYNLFSVL